MDKDEAASAMLAAERTWEISDIDGTNRRRVTLAQFRAELDAAKTKAEAIFAASVCSLKKES
jgi:hypothetical protein